MKLKYKLSKSTFIRGLQCEKSLYLHKHFYRLKDPVPAEQKAKFDQGNIIGLLAQQLFPGGVDASPNDYNKIAEAVETTKKLIDNNESIIYEATFCFNGILAALDILVKDDDGWKAYEVKSSTKVTETYLKDAAIQYYTIINSGIELKDISVIHINNKYIRNNELKIQKLFSIESVHDQVLEYLPIIPNEINRLKYVIDSDKVPEIDIGPHCNNPYDCDFKGVCWKHIPDYSIFDISRLKTKKKFELYKKGVITLNQIDTDNNFLNKKQLLQVKSEIEGLSHINKKEIKNFTSGLNYPLYFLDFETIGPAVPIFENTKPYQQIVFQYSLHIKKQSNSKILHKEYLADPTQDPRTMFVEQLIKDCDTYGDILVYNIGFERGKLNDLIEDFPQFSYELRQIIDRLKDLMIPFQKRWYYTPQMKGSYSIKYVLPALVPDLSYDTLNIKDGGTASNTFLAMVNGTFEGDYRKTREQLLEYCALDSYAMVKILQKLYEI